VTYPFASLIVGERLAHFQGLLIECCTEALDGCCGCGPIHLGEEHQATDALDQSAHGRKVEGPFNQVAFPVARQDALINFGRAQMNADQVRDLLTAIHTARSWAALGVPLAQLGDQLLAKLTVRHSIDRLVDGLVRLGTRDDWGA